ncbi:hypothetical protein A3735_16665 [Oleiphilus sp. HI0061]|uniref:hypothetical protein n=1 Tax=Oleiphilus sp. HI0061 TaxID=1822239 RepID=UPI0007CFDA74|nr:hypothetical protein [Oleiphilus sp. HI0061]KZY58916.1 hypothetical protein A3735_16665 [Oleiphilus sp. HI0061]
MEINSPLIQLALLESLKANEIADEIDLFLPFIAVTLTDLGKLEVTAENLQVKLEESFGFKPPISAIQVFMARARKRGLLHKENHMFIPNMDMVEKWKNGYDDKKRDIGSSVALLRQDFKEFASNKFNKELNEEECDALIIKFISKNVSSVTQSIRFEINELNEKIKNTDHVTASFISHIHKNKTASLEHFSRFVKGMLLANYLCYADQVSPKKAYDTITAYLDTPIIVGLLGFSGEQKRKSLKEFISLLTNVGINVCIFDKTLDETERLLSAWRDDLKRKKYGRFNTKTLELLRYLGYDADRLDSEIKLLKSRISKEQINIQLGFKAKTQYQCDENALEEAISPIFKGSKNLEHDTVCISRVYNSREGLVIKDLNQAFTVFVTPNTSLVNSANKHFRNEIPKQAIPLVVSEQWMTAMFWLKKPDMFGSLPMDQVVASAYGLLYTDDRFWSSFIKKMETLEKHGDISEEDLIQVRWDSDLLNMVHDVSVDVGEDFSEEDVFEIVEKIKRKHIKEKDQEIDQLSSEANQAISKLNREIEKKAEKLDNTKSHLEKIAYGIATIPALLLSLSVVICVFWATYSTLPTDIFPNVSPELRQHSATGIAFFVTLLFSFAGSIWGLNIISIFKMVREKAFIKTSKFLHGEN